MKQKAIRIGVFLLFSIAFSAIKAQTFTESPVSLKSVDTELKGSLIIPKGKGKFPLVIFHSGSGPTDRNGNQETGTNNSLKMLAESLAGSQIASLRYDKRGIAESKDSTILEKNMSIENFVDDLKNWIDFYSKDKRFSKIIIAGHSEGSLIGILAAQNNKKISGFISIAGAGRRLSEVMKEQFAKESSIVRKTVDKMIDTMAMGDTLSFFPPALSHIFRPSVQKFVISLFKYNPQSEIGRLNIPILVVQGTTDIQVTEEDADALYKGNQNAQKLIIENMNHVLKECELTRIDDQLRTYDNPELPLKSEISTGIIQFITDIK